ncbi:MAG TPA: hypothetical protein VLI05_07055 [Candidatus Saccharimonadia bacterium]|nr:hypothetical protein [Candidatus Saccharimonadia bacterium]
MFDSLFPSINAVFTFAACLVLIGARYQSYVAANRGNPGLLKLLGFWAIGAATGLVLIFLDQHVETVIGGIIGAGTCLLLLLMFCTIGWVCELFRR